MASIFLSNICGGCGSKQMDSGVFVPGSDLIKVADAAKEKATILFQQGCNLQEAGDLQNAIIHYQETIKLCPDHLDANYNLASAYHECGNEHWKEAELYYLKSININNRYYMAHYNLGYLYQDMGDLQKSILCFKEAASIEPQDPDIHINLGLVYKSIKDHNSAIAAYQTAIKVDPNNPMAHFNLGNIYQEQKRFDDAILQFREALRINGSHHDAQYNMGVAWQDKAACTLNITKTNQIVFLQNAMNCYQNARCLPEAELAIQHLQLILQSNSKAATSSEPSITTSMKASLHVQVN